MPYPTKYQKSVTNLWSIEKSFQKLFCIYIVASFITIQGRLTKICCLTREKIFPSTRENFSLGAFRKSHYQPFIVMREKIVKNSYRSNMNYEELAETIASRICKRHMI